MLCGIPLVSLIASFALLTAADPQPASTDPASKPAWATAMGMDQYGTWADLVVAGVMAKKLIPITTVSHMREILREMFCKRLGYRFKPGNDYFPYELWSMDSPPVILENTSMADQLDDALGFHLSEEELTIAYDEPISVSSQSI